MRYPVSMVLELLAAGMSNAEILANYHDLEAEDIQACLQFTAGLSPLPSESRLNGVFLMIENRTPKEIFGNEND